MAMLQNIGLTGINAAQSSLNSASNNIANVNTPGYHRTEPIVAQRAGSQGRGGGVQVTGTLRHYQAYLETQLRNAQGESSKLETHLKQISQIDNLLGDDEAGLAPLMEEFFSGLETIASDPTDISARESFMGNAHNMVAQFNAFAEYLDDMGSSVEGQLDSAVTQVNTATRKIADLNEQINISEARSGEAPTKLLDERDQLVTELGKLIDVDVTVQTTTTADGKPYENQSGTYLIVAGGRTLVDGNGSHELKLIDSNSKPGQKVLAYDRGYGEPQEMDTSRIKRGELAGLVDFRNDSLEPAKLKLDQLAHDFAVKFNSLHRQGETLDETQGQDFFSVSAPRVSFNDRNGGDVRLSAQFNTAGMTDINDIGDSLKDVQAANYEVKYKGGQYTITNLATGASEQTSTIDGYKIGGIEISLDSGTPQEGDRFFIEPLHRSARELDIEISDPADVAASAGGGVGDNQNALDLAALQNENVVGGNASFNDTYAQLVSSVGNKTHTLEVTYDSQETQTKDLQETQQSVSGVNLDEERVNIMNYVQMYQANATVIQTADTLFTSLLGIFR